MLTPRKYYTWPSNFYSLGNLIFALIASALSKESAFDNSCIPVWYHCLQTSSEKDTEQQQGQEQTQLKGKVKQLQDELEVTDQQITALNPLLHLDTLRQRCKQWSLTTIIVFVFLSVVVRYVCWQLTQKIGILFKRPSDTPNRKLYFRC